MKVNSPEIILRILNLSKAQRKLNRNKIQRVHPQVNTLVVRKMQPIFQKKV